MSPSTLGIVARGPSAPIDLDGLLLWLRADSLSLNHGDSVALWEDESGEGNDAAQETASKRPTWRVHAINGRPALRLLNGDNQHMRVADFPFAGTSFTLFLAISQATRNVLFSQWDFGTGERSIEVQLTAAEGALRVRLHDGSAIFKDYRGATEDLHDDGVHILEVLWDAGTLRLFVDGQEETVTKLSDAAGTSVADAAAELLVGGELNNGSEVSTPRAHYAHLLFYGAALSSGSRQGIRTWLNDQVGAVLEKTGDIALVQKIGLFAGSNPVIAVGGSGASDSKIREPGNILHEPGDTGAEFKTWYTGYDEGQLADSKIHYATSSDGVSWTKSPSNPVTTRLAQDPFIIKDGNTYHMFAEDVTSDPGQTIIGHWTSADGETWTHDGDVDLPGGNHGSSPAAIAKDGTFYLFYERMDVTPPTVYLATNSQLGRTGWVDQGEVLSHSAAPWADASLPGAAVVPDDVLERGGKFYMTFHARNEGGEMRAGIVTSDSLGSGWAATKDYPIVSDEDIWVRNVKFFDDGIDLVSLWLGETDTSGLSRGFPAAIASL